MTGQLYHYTCCHGRKAMGNHALLIPNYQPIIGQRLTWATDLAVPDAEALGLTAYYLQCDRTEVRYLCTEPGDWHYWPDYLAAQHLDPLAVSYLTGPPLQPKRWWVCAGYTPVTLYPQYVDKYE